MQPDGVTARFVSPRGSWRPAFPGAVLVFMALFTGGMVSRRQVIHGVSDDGSTKLWTADAGWGDSKYDYFKLLHGDGRLEESATTDSYHQRDAAYAFIDGRRIGVHIEELGSWQTSLLSPRMDSLYGQRYCRLRVEDGDQSFSGRALKEFWVGTVG